MVKFSKTKTVDAATHLNITKKSYNKLTSNPILKRKGSKNFHDNQEQDKDGPAFHLPFNIMLEILTKDVRSNMIQSGYKYERENSENPYLQTVRSYA